MRTGTWLEHFRNQCQILEDQFKAQAPQNTPLLSFALTQGFISSEEYLAWARSYFQIPVLKPDFFEAHPPKDELWKKFKNEYHWTMEILPIGHWDGHLLVACLELPASFPVALNPIFVLGGPQQLHSLWNKWQASEAQSSSTLDTPTQLMSSDPIVTAAPVAKKPAPAPTDEIILLDDQELVLSDNPSENSQGAEPAEEPVEPEAPTGLSLHSAATSTRTILVKDEPALAVKLDQTEGQTKTVALTKTAIANPVASSQQAETLTLTIQDFDKTVKEHPSPVTASNAPINSLAAASDVQLSQDKGPRANSYLLNLLFDKHQKEFSTEIKNIFSKMHAYFEKCMILSLDVHEEKLRPYFWDETFVSNTTHTDDISLNNPSFFKIVFVSQKPYHGYIVPNDINEKFFDEWNQGSLPSHITMTPLIINNRIVGMLMGQGEKASYAWSVLKFMENLTTDLNRKLSEIIEASAA